MEFLYRSAIPTYKGSQAQPTKPTGLLAGLCSVLGGGVTPAYKTVDGASAQAPATAPSWWRVFAVTPSYKTVTASEVDRVAPAEPSPDGGDGEAGLAGECEPAMQVVIL